MWYMESDGAAVYISSYWMHVALCGLMGHEVYYCLYSCRASEGCIQIYVYSLHPVNQRRPPKLITPWEFLLLGSWF